MQTKIPNQIMEIIVEIRKLNSKLELNKQNFVNSII